MSPTRLSEPLINIKARTSFSALPLLNTGAASRNESAKNQSHARMSKAYTTENHLNEKNKGKFRIGQLDLDSLK